MAKKSPESSEPSLTELMEEMAAMDEVVIQTTDDEPPPPPPRERKPVQLATVSDPNQALRWEDWGISVKASAEDKEAVAREVIAKLKKGENHVMGVRYDCVMYGCRTEDGIFLYDCVAKKRATLK